MKILTIGCILHVTCLLLCWLRTLSLMVSWHSLKPKVVVSWGMTYLWWHDDIRLKTLLQIQPDSFDFEWIFEAFQASSTRMQCLSVLFFTDLIMLLLYISYILQLSLHCIMSIIAFKKWQKKTKTFALPINVYLWISGQRSAFAGHHHQQ